MTPSDIDKLIEAAEKAVNNAIAPHSKFKVGAAVLAADGRTFTGCNIENPSLMLTCCAERIALLKALSEGCKSFKALAVVSNKGDYCFPCGCCRQMLSEFAPGISIYLKSKTGIKRYSIEELLPYPFVR